MKNKVSNLSLFYVVLNTIIFIVIIEKTDAITEFKEKIENSLSTLHHSLPVILQSLQIPSRSYKKEDILIAENPNFRNKDNPEVENETREKELNVEDNSKNLPKLENFLSKCIDEFSETQVDYSQSNSSFLETLENYSCKTEALNYGYQHIIEIIIHESFCELNKLFHYILIAVNNLQPESPLIWLFNIAQDIISFGDLIFNETTLPEIVEVELSNLEEFLHNPENIKILINNIKKSIPIFIPIARSIIKLVNSVKEIFYRVQNLFEHLDFNYLEKIEDLKEIGKKLFILGKQLITSLYNLALSPLKEIKNLFFDAIIWVESIFNDLLNNIQQKLYQYTVFLEEGINILQTFYNGFYASGFSETLNEIFSIIESSVNEMNEEKTNLNVSISSTLISSQSNLF
ncbi:uncharacterized protein LOC122718702 [Apis laboriosa]|uniref:uncharacterized protein LOC122718702 n=1 Tax=Apis laboriosa TaxID=183418 RepID=UPI001CC461BF|nr:uncharacterized protein LOC122718702 [Apis laboriosa]